MPVYFIFFLATLAASLLLYLGAIASVAINRGPPPFFIRGVPASQLQATGVALLWFGVGVCWLLFFNVYRIHVDLSGFGDAAFQAFNRGYTRRLPIVVLPTVQPAWRGHSRYGARRYESPAALFGVSRHSAYSRSSEVLGYADIRIRVGVSTNSQHGEIESMQSVAIPQRARGRFVPARSIARVSTPGRLHRRAARLSAAAVCSPG